MGWARLDDGFHDHPKVDGLSLAAVGLWTLCLTHAHRHRRTAPTQGHVAEARARKFAGSQAHRLASELMDAGLWEPVEGGWLIHDFADYTRKERDPEEARNSGRKGAASKWQNAPPDMANSHPNSQEVATGLASEKLANGMANDGSRASAPASPTRTQPKDELNSGGNRPVTLRPADATTPPDDGETCTRHPNGNPADEPCRGCQRVEERKRRRAERAETARIEAAQRAREACPDCGGGVWLDDGTKCTHPKTTRRTA